MGRACMNQILDTRTYQVELAQDELKELNATIIAESMHDQCNSDRN